MQGFEDDVQAVLQRRYPAEMMGNLQSFSHGALQDIKEAFPDDTILPNANLYKFLQASSLLLHIRSALAARAHQVSLL